MPAFVSVRLSTIGIPDKNTFKKIAEATSKNGGVFVKDPSPSAQLTHLLCGDGGSPDMKAPWTANAKVVWEEWFWDSLNAYGKLYLIVSTLLCSNLLVRDSE